MHLFYCNGKIESRYTLNEEESKHCIRVLRLSKGDSIVLVDGKGAWCDVKIIDDNPKKCIVEIIKKTERHHERKTKLHIAIAPTKNIERMEWFLEKATEIGVDEITLLLCHNSERGIVKTERLNKVLISAMKQCQSAYLPVLNDLIDLDAFVVNQHYSQKFIAHCAESKEKTPLKNECKKNEATLILIGPEGDFTNKEIALCLQNNFKEVSLSSNRLRTETAGIMACSTFDLVNS